MCRKQQTTYDFDRTPCGRSRSRRAFTIVEIAAAVLILSMILTSVMVLMNRYIGAVLDLRLRDEAFELARTNMEILLTENQVSEMTDYGQSESNPDIEWETTVEPFYEPITDRMWIRAVCSAGFFDSQGNRQDVELEHWITNLTAAQVKQILAQQEIEEEYLELLEGGEETEIQETTRAYLEEQGLDAESYDRFIEKQRREKLKYISEKGMDGYDAFLEELKEQENIFLEELGMDFDGYNDFAATYVPQSRFSDDALSDENAAEGNSDVDTPDRPVTEEPANDGIDWNNVPKELWPMLESLGFKPPK